MAHIQSVNQKVALVLQIEEKGHAVQMSNQGIQKACLHFKINLCKCVK